MTPLRVASRGLNLRTGAGTAHPALHVLPHRTLVLPGIERDGWRQVIVPEWDRATGWVSARYLEPIPHHQDGDPLYMAIMLAHLGESEIAGRQHNDWVLRCHATTSLAAKSDEVAWCSSSVNACVRWAGLRGTNSAAARSWVGHGTKLDGFRRGCIVVISRSDPSNPNAAHVGIGYSTGANTIRILGGNQGNQVSIAGFARSRVLWYGWPV